MYNQAQKIIDKFGGVPRLATAIGCDPSAIYKWNYTKDSGGTGGLVPSSAVAQVIKAADALGIELEPTVWNPN